MSNLTIKHFLYILFIQTNKNEHHYKAKLLLKIISHLFTYWEVKYQIKSTSSSSCYFHTPHAS